MYRVATLLLCLWIVWPASAEPGRKLTPAEIDRELASRWPAAKLEPSPPASDLTYLRRVYLDLAGVIPSMAALSAFRADARPDAREQLVDLLLSTKRFAGHWAEVLRHVIVGRAGKLDANLGDAFEHWLAQRLMTRGVGLDRVVREIVAAEGTPVENPAIVPLLAFEDSKEDMAGHLTRVFLGAQIQCAQCHDHPFEAYKQTDFYGMAAFFARTRRAQIPTAAYEKVRAGEITTASELAPYLDRPIVMDAKSPELARLQAQLDRLRGSWQQARLDPQAYQGASTVAEAAESMEMAGAMKNGGPKQLPLLFEALDGEITLPKKPGESTGAGAKPKPVPPRFLSGPPPVYPDRGLPRRDRLARWMTAPDNPLFARTLVNRVWARLMGRGLVEPVDNVAHPADTTHQALLGRLAEHFVASGHDLRELVRLIVSTEAYRRSVVPNATNARDVTLYSRGLSRALDPEQIFASILEATGVEHTFKDGQGPQFMEMKRRFERQFVFSFANDEAGETVSYQGTIAQALFALNAPAFNRPVKADPGGALDAMRAQAVTPAERVRHLTLRVLSREPTEAEVARLTDYVRTRSEDLTWGVRPAAPPAPPAPTWWSRLTGTRPVPVSPSPVAPPSPAAGKARRPAIPAVKRMESMWRAYEDVLWAMIASTEFQVNH